MAVASISIPACGHGVRRELAIYRNVRMWEMNCGEVACSLSRADFFGNEGFAKEWIDAALRGKMNPMRLQWSWRCLLGHLYPPGEADPVCLRCGKRWSRIHGA
jgi:hypothetical protein